MLDSNVNIASEVARTTPRAGTKTAPTWKSTLATEKDTGLEDIGLSTSPSAPLQGIDLRRKPKDVMFSNLTEFKNHLGSMINMEVLRL